MGSSDALLTIGPQDMREYKGVLRNLKNRDWLYSICCVLGLDVSLPRCLLLWHCPFPLCLFLGGAQPGVLSLLGSKVLGPHHHLQAIALHKNWKEKTMKYHYLHSIYILFSCALIGLNMSSTDKYFPHWENKQSRDLL